MMNYSIHQRRLKIKFDNSMMQHTPMIKFDKRRLQQVLLNLLSNACKFQTTGHIQVKASCAYANAASLL